MNLFYCLMGKATHLIIDQSKKSDAPDYWDCVVYLDPYRYAIKNGENWGIMGRVPSDFLFSTISVSPELNDTLSVYLENIY